MCLTHIPGAYEDGYHVRLILVGMFILHQLQQLAKSLPLLICTNTHIHTGILIEFSSLKEKYHCRVEHYIKGSVSMDTELIEDICMSVCGTSANTVSMIMNIQIEMEMQEYFPVCLNANVCATVMFVGRSLHV